MKAYQKNIDNVANNIANVSTSGYKASHASFEDLLHSQMSANNPTLLQGNGVKLANLRTDFSQGNLQQSGYELDFAIVGEGFYACMNNGEIKYTRDGAFSIGRVNNENYLVRNDGSFILDQNFQPIRLVGDPNQGFDTSKLKEQVGLFTFSNKDGLQRSNATTFIATQNSGNARSVNPNERMVLQGVLEMSNLELSQGMVSLMEGQKAFQLNARVIQSADQVEEMVNNLR